MKKFFSSFLGKITAIFLMLLLALVIVQIWVSVHSSWRFVQESEQKLNRGLAKSIAEEFKPFLQDSIHFAEIENLIHYVMVLNPRIEIYLLDEAGKILTFFAVPKEKVVLDQVSMKSINNYLLGQAKMPILGDDPRNLGRQKPFSATPIEFGNGQSGYLYVILGSEQYDSAAEMIEESYILRGSALGLMLAVIITGIIGIILFAVLTKRLHRMNNVVKLFQTGNHRARIYDKSKDEIGQLASSFNQMADTLAANMEEMKQTDNLRRELVANVSHDLRSPLASIQGYLETIMMKEDSINPDEKEKYLEIIYKNTRMLNELVSELFELSKLEAKQIQPKKEPFSMVDLTQDVVLKFKPLAEKLNVRLTAEMAPQLPFVTADIGLIERALSNLIDNAVRYTPEKGSVEVRLKERAGQVIVSISDTGKGIPAEELPHIFERFSRIEKNLIRPSGGAGLGLAIAQKILEIHNSRIQVQSKPDIGTQFSFALPSGVGF